MNIDKNQIKKISALIRINLSELEIEEFLPQLKEILNYFNKLDELNTDNIEPSFLPIEIEMGLREDKIEKSLSVKKALSNTIHKEENFFKGPRVLWKK